MTHDPVLPPELFARPDLEPHVAESMRRRTRRALAGPEAASTPEAALAAVFGALLLVWAVHAVLPG